jgi:hypothetical protein
MLVRRFGDERSALGREASIAGGETALEAAAGGSSFARTPSLLKISSVPERSD